jgi:hypothetical protein
MPVTAINWTPTTTPDCLRGEPGDYLIQVHRTANGTTGLPDPRGRISFCSVYQERPGGKWSRIGNTASIAKARVLAERHAAEWRK